MSRESFYLAVEDFHRARRQASMQRILARLTGRSVDLLSYEDARRKLRGIESSARQLKNIPLDAIVGTVGRYADFTRSFLPRRAEDEVRWARVKAQMTGLEGLPPIEVYQIGDVYFVRDGHHRVSVARQLGSQDIEAYVTPVHTKVPISVDIRSEDLILKQEYAEFLQDTYLDVLRPGSDLGVTAPGHYQVLKEHIDVHRYFMGIEQKRPIPYPQAVADWYDKVYLPVVQAIRERGILRDFPGRTETDLYLWISEHRAALQGHLGWGVEPGAAAADLAARSGRTVRRVAARLAERLAEAATPEGLAGGPIPGQWRKEHMIARPDDRLFRDILVPVSGQGGQWYALDQALEIARRENARLHGIHAVSSEALAEDPRTGAVKAEFERRCEAGGVQGNLTVEIGKVARQVYEHAWWADLVVVNLAHPPSPRLLARMGSGFRTLLRRCAAPLLAVPQVCSPLQHALLAYDGSSKADEALFVATYLSGRWDIPLVVVTVAEKERTSDQTLRHAEEYLRDHAIRATPVITSGPAGKAILRTADEHGIDFIVMGGYGFSPVLEAMLGSSVYEVLRGTRYPVLICQ